MISQNLFPNKKLTSCSHNLTNQQLLPIYTDWANRYLLRAKFKPICDLTGELCNPKILVNFIYAVTNDCVQSSRENLNSILSLSDPVECISKCLKYLLNLGVNVSTIYAKNIRNGHLGAILSLLFAISCFKQQQKTFYKNSIATTINFDKSNSKSIVANQNDLNKTNYNQYSSNLSNNKSVYSSSKQSTSSGYSSGNYATVIDFNKNNFNKTLIFSNSKDQSETAIKNSEHKVKLPTVSLKQLKITNNKKSEKLKNQSPVPLKKVAFQMPPNSATSIYNKKTITKTSTNSNSTNSNSTSTKAIVSLNSKNFLPTTSIASCLKPPSVNIIPSTSTNSSLSQQNRLRIPSRNLINKKNNSDQIETKNEEKIENLSKINLPLYFQTSNKTKTDGSNNISNTVESINSQNQSIQLKKTQENDNVLFNSINLNLNKGSQNKSTSLLIKPQICLKTQTFKANAQNIETVSNKINSFLTVKKTDSVSNNLKSFEQSTDFVLSNSKKQNQNIKEETSSLNTENNKINTPSIKILSNCLKSTNSTSQNILFKEKNFNKIKLKNELPISQTENSSQSFSNLKLIKPGTLSTNKNYNLKFENSNKLNKNFQMQNLNLTTKNTSLNSPKISQTSSELSKELLKNPVYDDTGNKNLSSKIALLEKAENSKLIKFFDKEKQDLQDSSLKTKSSELLPSKQLKTPLYQASSVIKSNISKIQIPSTNRKTTNFTFQKHSNNDGLKMTDLQQASTSNIKYSSNLATKKKLGNVSKSTQVLKVKNSQSFLTSSSSTTSSSSHSLQADSNMQPQTSTNLQCCNNNLIISTLEVSLKKTNNQEIDTSLVVENYNSCEKLNFKETINSKNTFTTINEMKNVDFSDNNKECNESISENQYDWNLQSEKRPILAVKGISLINNNLSKATTSVKQLNSSTKNSLSSKTLQSTTVVGIVSPMLQTTPLKSSANENQSKKLETNLPKSFFLNVSENDEDNKNYKKNKEIRNAVSITKIKNEKNKTNNSEKNKIKLQNDESKQSCDFLLPIPPLLQLTQRTNEHKKNELKSQLSFNQNINNLIPELTSSDLPMSIKRVSNNNSCNSMFVEAEEKLVAYNNPEKFIKTDNTQYQNINDLKTLNILNSKNRRYQKNCRQKHKYNSYEDSSSSISSGVSENFDDISTDDLTGSSSDYHSSLSPLMTTASANLQINANIGLNKSLKKNSLTKLKQNENFSTFNNNKQFIKKSIFDEHAVYSNLEFHDRNLSNTELLEENLKSFNKIDCLNLKQGQNNDKISEKKTNIFFCKKKLNGILKQYSNGDISKVNTEQSIVNYCQSERRSQLSNNLDENLFLYAPQHYYTIHDVKLSKNNDSLKFQTENFEQCSVTEPPQILSPPISLQQHLPMLSTDCDTFPYTFEKVSDISKLSKLNQNYSHLPKISKLQTYQTNIKNVSNNKNLKEFLYHNQTLNNEYVSNQKNISSTTYHTHSLDRNAHLKVFSIPLSNSKMLINNENKLSSTPSSPYRLATLNKGTLINNLNNPSCDEIYKQNTLNDYSNVRHSVSANKGNLRRTIVNNSQPINHLLQQKLDCNNGMSKSMILLHEQQGKKLDKNNNSKNIINCNQNQQSLINTNQQNIKRLLLKKESQLSYATKISSNEIDAYKNGSISARTSNEINPQLNYSNNLNLHKLSTSSKSNLIQKIVPEIVGYNPINRSNFSSRSIVMKQKLQQNEGKYYNFPLTRPNYMFSDDKIAENLANNIQNSNKIFPMSNSFDNFDVRNNTQFLKTPTDIVKNKYLTDMEQIYAEINAYQETISNLTAKHDNYNHLIQTFDNRLKMMMKHVENLQKSSQIKPDEVEKLCLQIENLHNLTCNAGVNLPPVKQIINGCISSKNLLNEPLNENFSHKSLNIEQNNANLNNKNETKTSVKNSKIGVANVLEKTRIKKSSWIRSSFSRAFHKANAKKSKSKNGSVSDFEQSPLHNSVKNLANSAQKVDASDVDFLSLKKQLEDKDLALTDVRLDALDKAREVDILRETIHRLKNENKILKHNFTILERQICDESRTNSQQSISTCCHEIDVNEKNLVPYADEIALPHNLLTITNDKLNSTTNSNYKNSLFNGSNNLIKNFNADKVYSSSAFSKRSSNGINIRVTLCVDFSGKLDFSNQNLSPGCGTPSNSFVLSNLHNQTITTNESHNFNGKGLTASKGNVGSSCTIASTASTSSSFNGTFSITSSTSNSFLKRELTIGFLTMPVATNHSKTLWQDIDQQLGLLLEDYLHRIDPEMTLGINDSFSSIIGYQLNNCGINGDEVFIRIRNTFYQNEENKEVVIDDQKEIEPSQCPTEFLKSNSSICIKLSGVAQNSFDALVIESLFPKVILRQLFNYFIQSRRLLLYGGTGIGKSNVSRYLAKYLTMRLKIDAKNVFDIRFPDDDKDISKTQTIKDQLITLLKNNNSKDQKIIILDNIQRKRIDIMTEIFNIADLNLNKNFSNSPFVICTLNRTSESLVQKLQIHHNFRLFSLNSKMDAVKGFMGRYLRRRIAEDELSKMSGQTNNTNLNTVNNMLNHQFQSVIEFLGKVLDEVNKFIENANAFDVTLGPRIFLQCPLQMDASKEWFIELWNEKIIPYMTKVAKDSQNFLGTRGLLKDPTVEICENWPWINETDSYKILKRISVPIVDTSYTNELNNQLVSTKNEVNNLSEKLKDFDAIDALERIEENKNV